VPLYTGPTKAQEESPELNKEDNNNTIYIEIITSNYNSKSSDDSDDRDYIEECL
jgi:hypothetical protein